MFSAIGVPVSRLAPGFVGLWRINVKVEPDTPVGSDIPVVINYDGKSTQAGVTVAATTATEE